jgi:hypothetical protein
MSVIMESSRERKELAEYLAALPLFGRGIVLFFLNVRFAHSIPRLSFDLHLSSG